MTTNSMVKLAAYSAVIFVAITAISFAVSIYQTNQTVSKVIDKTEVVIDKTEKAFDKAEDVTRGLIDKYKKKATTSD